MLLLFQCLEFQQKMAVLQSTYGLLGEEAVASSPLILTSVSVRICLLFQKLAAERNLGIWLSNVLTLRMSQPNSLIVVMPTCTTEL